MSQPKFEIGQTLVVSDREHANSGVVATVKGRRKDEFDEEVFVYAMETPDGKRAFNAREDQLEEPAKPVDPRALRKASSVRPDRGDDEHLQGDQGIATPPGHKASAPEAETKHEAKGPPQHRRGR